jgi:hypothetical protein
MLGHLPACIICEDTQYALSLSHSVLHHEPRGPSTKFCLTSALQAKLAQEAMLALEQGMDGGMRQALGQAPDIILPRMSALQLP